MAVAKQPKEILSMMVDSNGMANFTVVFKQAWLSYPDAMKLCGKQMINAFLSDHGLGLVDSPCKQVSNGDVESITNQMFSDEGVVMFQVKFHNVQLCYKEALQFCGLEMIRKFQQNHGLGMKQHMLASSASLRKQPVQNGKVPLKPPIFNTHLKPVPSTISTKVASSHVSPHPGLPLPNKSTLSHQQLSKSRFNSNAAQRLLVERKVVSQSSAFQNHGISQNSSTKLVTQWSMTPAQHVFSPSVVMPPQTGQKENFFQDVTSIEENYQRQSMQNKNTISFSYTQTHPLQNVSKYVPAMALSHTRIPMPPLEQAITLNQLNGSAVRPSSNHTLTLADVNSMMSNLVQRNSQYPRSYIHDNHQLSKGPFHKQNTDTNLLKQLPLTSYNQHQQMLAWKLLSTNQQKVILQNVKQIPYPSGLSPNRTVNFVPTTTLQLQMEKGKHVDPTLFTSPFSTIYNSKPMKSVPHIFPERHNTPTSSPLKHAKVKSSENKMPSNNVSRAESQYQTTRLMQTRCERNTSDGIVVSTPHREKINDNPPKLIPTTNVTSVITNSNSPSNAPSSSSTDSQQILPVNVTSTTANIVLSTQPANSIDAGGHSKVSTSSAASCSVQSTTRTKVATTAAATDYIRNNLYCNECDMQFSHSRSYFLHANTSCKTLSKTKHNVPTVTTTVSQISAASVIALPNLPPTTTLSELKSQSETTYSNTSPPENSSGKVKSPVSASHTNKTITDVLSNQVKKALTPPGKKDSPSKTIFSPLDDEPILPITGFHDLLDDPFGNTLLSDILKTAGVLDRESENEEQHAKGEKKLSPEEVQANRDSQITHETKFSSMRDQDGAVSEAVKDMKPNAKSRAVTEQSEIDNNKKKLAPVLFDILPKNHQKIKSFENVNNTTKSSGFSSISATEQHYSATVQHYSATDQHNNATEQHYSATVQHYSATEQHNSATVQHYSATEQHNNATVQNDKRDTAEERKFKRKKKLVSVAIEEDFCSSGSSFAYELHEDTVYFDVADEFFIPKRHDNNKTIVDGDGKNVRNKTSDTLVNNYDRKVSKKKKKKKTKKKLQSEKEKSSKPPRDEHSKLPRDENLKLPRDEHSKLPSDKNSKLPRDKHSKLPRDEYSKLSRDEYSKLPRDEYSKSPRGKNSKSPRDKNSKLPRDEHSKSPREEHSKSPREEHSKSPRDEHSKSPRDEHSKSPRDEHSKSPRDEHSKLPRDEHSKSPRDEHSKSPRDEHSKPPRDERKSKKKKSNTICQLETYFSQELQPGRSSFEATENAKSSLDNFRTIKLNSGVLSGGDEDSCEGSTTPYQMSAGSSRRSSFDDLCNRIQLSSTVSHEPQLNLRDDLDFVNSGTRIGGKHEDLNEHASEDVLSQPNIIPVGTKRSLNQSDDSCENANELLSEQSASTEKNAERQLHSYAPIKTSTSHPKREEARKHAGNLDDVALMTTETLAEKAKSEIALSADQCFEDIKRTLAVLSTEPVTDYKEVDFGVLSNDASWTSDDAKIVKKSIDNKMDWNYDDKGHVLLKSGHNSGVNVDASMSKVSFSFKPSSSAQKSDFIAPSQTQCVQPSLSPQKPSSETSLQKLFSETSSQNPLSETPSQNPLYEMSSQNLSSETSFYEEPSFEPTEGFHTMAYFYPKMERRNDSCLLVKSPLNSPICSILSSVSGSPGANDVDSSRKDPDSFRKYSDSSRKNSGGKVHCNGSSLPPGEFDLSLLDSKIKRLETENSTSVVCAKEAVEGSKTTTSREMLSGETNRANKSRISCLWEGVRARNGCSLKLDFSSSTTSPHHDQGGLRVVREFLCGPIVSASRLDGRQLATSPVSSGFTRTGVEYKGFVDFEMTASHDRSSPLSSIARLDPSSISTATSGNIAGVTSFGPHVPTTFPTLSIENTSNMPSHGVMSPKIRRLRKRDSSLVEKSIPRKKSRGSFKHEKTLTTHSPSNTHLPDTVGVVDDRSVISPLLHDHLSTSESSSSSIVCAFLPSPVEVLPSSCTRNGNEYKRFTSEFFENACKHKRSLENSRSLVDCRSGASTPETIPYKCPLDELDILYDATRKPKESMKRSHSKQKKPSDMSYYTPPRTRGHEHLNEIFARIDAVKSCHLELKVLIPLQEIYNMASAKGLSILSRNV